MEGKLCAVPSPFFTLSHEAFVRVLSLSLFAVPPGCLFSLSLLIKGQVDSKAAPIFPFVFTFETELNTL